MWADLINKDKVHRALWCALYMAVTLLLQNTVFAHIALFGVHAMFVPAVVVAVGVFEGGTWGAVFGLIAGYFCAMGYPGTGMPAYRNQPEKVREDLAIISNSFRAAHNKN